MWTAFPLFGHVSPVCINLRRMASPRSSPRPSRGSRTLRDLEPSPSASPPGSDSEDQDESISGDTSHIAWVVEIDTKKKCKLCGEFSSSKSPLSSASKLDEFGGLRPWAKYKKMIARATKYPRARQCLICLNVFRQIGSYLSALSGAFTPLL